ncbi:MAG: hypothetical protein IJO73_08880 [Clostridia bacterium]|nr:hypothetical protein [Clostridia bacterium]
MFKRFIANTLWSTLALLMMSVIFTCAGFTVIELNLAPHFLVQILFIAVLLIGFFVGGRLYYRKSLSIVSIVILPVILCAVLYFIGFAVPYIGYIIQYPSPVWIEAYDLSLDYTNEADTVRYYAVLLAHYSASALSLLLGARKRCRDS